MTRHNWRWGMLFMHVYNDGFGFRLDARLREGGTVKSLMKDENGL